MILKQLTLIPAGLALLLGCSDGGSQQGGFSMPPMPVEVALAERRAVEERFDGVGTIEAIDAITVVSEIDAIVTSLPFKEGSEVHKGDLLAQLDDTQLSADLARAEALLAQSQASYDRVKTVVEQRAAAPQDLDDAAASLKVAEANVAISMAKLSKSRITAPFNGIVGSRKVSRGAFVRAGQPITDLANLDAMRVHFSAPERFLPRLRPGAEVSVSTTAYPGMDQTGKIIAVEPILDAETRSTRILARVDNPGRRFRPGMSANISAVLSKRTDAITIPNEAVFAAGSDSFVFVVGPDSSVGRARVVLGTRLSEIVEVLEGLEPGTMVVRAGHQKLYDGAKVMPMTSRGNAQAEQNGEDG